MRCIRYLTIIGWAMIAFTVILRIILLPISLKQQKSLRTNSKMQEEMKQLQFRYKNNPEKLNQEMMAMYKRYGTSPFSGCLSGILQILIVISVFILVSQPLTHMKKLTEKYDENAEDESIRNKTVIEYYADKIQEENEGRASYREIGIINKYGAEDERVNLNMDFFGLDLGKVPTQNLGDWTVYIIPVLYVISSVISIRMTNNITKKKKNEEGIVPAKTEEELAMEQMNKNMSYMMPIMSISIAFIAPLGLALYWLVGNLVMIAERILINIYFQHKEEKENA